MKIEFDPNKAAINPLNHDGVTFEEAKAVLLDPYALTQEDKDIEGEQLNLKEGVMNNNLDSDYNLYANIDFSNAKPVDEIPALAKLQVEHGKKICVTMHLDSDIMAIFKARAEIANSSYEVLINNALRTFAAM